MIVGSKSRWKQRYKNMKIILRILNRFGSIFGAIVMTMLVKQSIYFFVDFGSHVGEVLGLFWYCLRLCENSKDRTALIESTKLKGFRNRKRR